MTSEAVPVENLLVLLVLVESPGAGGEKEVMLLLPILFFLK